MLLYVIIAFIYKKNKLKIHYIVFMLFCVTCIECTMNMEETGYSTTGRSAYLRDYDSVEYLVSEAAAEDNSFYRIAKAFGYRSKNKNTKHKNPDPENVRCYRVVNRFGEVSKAFAFGGENEQIRLLKSEGVEVDENGRVDLKKYGMV